MTTMRWIVGLMAASVLGCGGDDGGQPVASSSSSSETGGGTETSGSAGTSTSDASSSADTTTAGETTGGAQSCAGQDLRGLPDAFTERGPWTVGARTIAIAGRTVELWYPAAPGSEAGIEPIRYDIREHLPRSEQGKIADADNPWQDCDCYRDLAPDPDYGPYPVVVFVHGTASFRTQSLPQMVHWASRGYVVIAADHPGLQLADLLASVCGGPTVAQDLAADIDAMLAAIRGETDELAFLGDRLDATRIGMAGHSAGGGAIAGRGDDAAVLIPMAAGGTTAGAALVSTLVLGGTADSIVAYDQQLTGYASSPAPKRLVGLAEAGHLAFSEICSLHDDAGQNLLEIAEAAGVCGAQFAGFLFQCSDALLPDADAWAIVDHATSAVLDETLHCRDIGAAFDQLPTLLPGVAEVRQD